MAKQYVKSLINLFNTWVLVASLEEVQRCQAHILKIPCKNELNHLVKPEQTRF